MKKLFTILLSLMFFITYGQQLRTETQTYKDGLATFQCYENPESLETVKHGTFKFVENLKGKYGSWSVLVTGNFKNGLRDGLWSYKIIQIDAEDNYGNYKTGTLLSTQNFKNGYPNGLWTYSNSYKTRPLKWNGKNYIFGNFDKPINESANFTFKNGKVVGILKYNINGIIKTINLNSFGIIVQKSLFFNSNGITNGIYFSNGFIIRDFEKINKSGTITSDHIFDSIPLNKQIDTVRIKIPDLEEFFENDYFTLWGGDLTYKNEYFYRNYVSCLKILKE